MDSPLSYLDLHPFVRATVINKIFGVIIGSAIGDAVGLYTEFLPASKSRELYSTNRISLIPPATPFHSDSHRDKFTPGGWTDDTDHALMLLLSYLHHGRLDPQDFAARLKTWCDGQGLRVLNRPPLGIGRTVKTVVSHPLFTDTPEEAAKDRWEKTGRYNAANGSLMRIHPIGIVAIGMGTIEEAWEHAMANGMVTHWDPRCVVCCCIQVGLLRAILRGDISNVSDVDEIVEGAFKWVSSRGEMQPELWKSSDGEKIPLDYFEFRKYMYAEGYETLQLDDSKTMGYVYKCLGSALFVLRAAIQGEPFSSVSSEVYGFYKLIECLLQEGGDADTNCCVAGALLGAWYGYGALPSQWRDGLVLKEWLMDKTTNLMITLGVIDGLYDGKNDKDTAMDGGQGWLSKEEMDKVEGDLVRMVLEKARDRAQEAKAKQKDRKMGGSTVWGRVLGL
ncbi:ADP-ribosylglycohydrolase-domain-containing protein [Pyronema omphalodes]|nr:ADP-ribosylglycohydrolase-domain-containing protein [Pyronema omphalodes]